MGQAQEALGQEAETVFVESDRQAFLGLATGNAHAHPNYVLLRELRSFPLPLHLRKDPRGHYMKEARAALFGHADSDVHGAPHREEIAAARMMMAQDPAMRKRVLEVVRSDQGSYVERFNVGAAALEPLGAGARLALAPRARLSLEIVDDVVTMVAHAPGGERRVIRDGERDAIAARLGPGSPSSAGSDGDAVLGELVQAGVLARTSD
jgi:hypothetical protein